MFNKKEQKELEQAIREEVSQTIREVVKDTTKVLGKLGEITRLKEEIEDLKLEKKTREWDYEKKEMEVEHKIGLERKRQEFEIDQSKREAIVSVREENLTADKARFEEQMGFIEKRFTEEVEYLKEIMGDVLKCLKKNGGIEPDGNGK